MKKFCIICVLVAITAACGVSQETENIAEVEQVGLIEQFTQQEPIVEVELIEQTTLISYTPPNNNIFTVNSGDTTDRGFHIDGFNIYDKNGNLLITADEEGFTPFGTQVAPSFYVLYGGFSAEDTIGTAIIEDIRGGWWYASGGTDTANGIWHFPAEDEPVLIPNGDNYIGHIIELTPEEPRLRIGVLEADMPYLDFVIINIVRNREEARIIGLPSGGYVNYVEFNFESAFSGAYKVVPIARGGSGFARILVQTVE
ncbi:MAG: hypothetical protein FWG65_12105 [Turicibacter sp.]|nr:hypothetical protein [Turicibacter sp.]